MKFPPEGGIGYLQGDQRETRKCYVIAVKKGSVKQALTINILDPRGHTEDSFVEDLEAVPLDKTDPSKTVQLGTSLNSEQWSEMLAFLHVGFIEEVHYLDWIANLVIVKKANGKLWVCVDYSDLNRACPKDSFPLPRIDQLVDSTAGHELLSFLDTYSGYNQITTHPPDRQKTTFVTDNGLYCYRVMPFGLKNARVTYQRLVNQMFAKQIRRSMEFYVDDMLVKSTKASNHLADLGETFSILQEYQMKLNPAKCAFGVGSGKFLGFQIPRAENSWADALAKLASATKGKIPRVIPVEFIEHPSIDQIEKKMVNPVGDTLSWIDLIYNYLTFSEVSSDKLEARRLRVRAAWCLRPDEADYVIREIHEGICENHSGGWALALKILRQGHFCRPSGRTRKTMFKGATSVNGKVQVEFAIVAVDYFTKWAEAEPVDKIIKQKVVARFYNAKVKTRCFCSGDLVLCQVFQIIAEPGAGRLKVEVLIELLDRINASVEAAVIELGGFGGPLL
ncbi:uncharacterized protein LOC131249739 [Magnolia sinica]|uniref:uncharacterized protein LOC131249739 n=1 Tax=Magnolia sinica TaxID=86752 RepID=UPI0026582D37|nr:uncharacterized protein LOC131249739 [Magnolia sinica]